MRHMLMLSLFLLLIPGRFLFSQVSINSNSSPPDPSSALDVSHTGRGLLIPRMTLAQRDAISLPANALLIYQTDIMPGFYYNRGTPNAPVWVSLTSLDDLVHLEDRIPIDSLPYTISSPGSYYVTADLTGPQGITIASSHVTLDLNGYALTGSPGNNDEGINCSLTSVNITIRNGSVVNWSREGIKAPTVSNSHFSHLQLLSNDYDGISAGDDNLLSYVVASNNGFDGIDVAQSTSLFHCTASGNMSDGIEADSGSSLTECTVSQNAQNGIRTTGASTISNCSALSNTDHGFSCGAGSVVKQCTATNNTESGFYLFSSSIASDNNSRSNGHHGFEWLSDCVLESNAASQNSMSGFHTTYNGGKLDHNTSTSNFQHGFNVQNTGGCLIIRNTASDNTINDYNVLPGNGFASVVTIATLNSTTNPFANFQL